MAFITIPKPASSGSGTASNYSRNLFKLEYPTPYLVIIKSAGVKGFIVT